MVCSKGESNSFSYIPATVEYTKTSRQWVLQTGDRATALACKEWIEARTDAEGNLPEQVTEHLIDECYLPYWQQRWGFNAQPLLWSHAMYVVLCHMLEQM